MWGASRNPKTSAAPMTTVSTVPRPAAVTTWRRRTVPAARVIPQLSSLLRQLETHPRLHRPLHRSAVDEQRRVAPALDGTDGRLVEDPGRRRLDDVHIAGLAAGAHGELEHHVAGNALCERRRGVVRRRDPQT